MKDLPVTQFGLTIADMDSCARNVLSGDKCATTSLRAAYDHDHEPLPKVGQRSVVRDGGNHDIAIIEVTKVEIRRYDEVDAAYAAIEGEGDKSLAHWQHVHWEFLAHECARIDMPLTPKVEVVLEYFTVVRRCCDDFY